MECTGARSTVRTAVRSTALVVGTAALTVLAAGGVAAAGRASSAPGPGPIGSTTLVVALPERVRAANRAW